MRRHFKSTAALMLAGVLLLQPLTTMASGVQVENETAPVIDVESEMTENEDVENVEPETENAAEIKETTDAAESAEVEDAEDAAEIKETTDAAESAEVTEAEDTTDTEVESEAEVVTGDETEVEVENVTETEDMVEAEDDVVSTAASNIKLSNDYDTKVSNFTSDSRWKHGIAWADARRPKLSKWSSIGCCAYAADFAAYVYGSGTKAWTDTSKFSKFYSANEIRTGDIIHTGTHWFVVLWRRGNTLHTAEGNFDDKVRIKSNGYTIKNGSLYLNGYKKSIKTGYHYKFSDMSSLTPTFKGTATPDTTSATIKLNLGKSTNTTIMGYGMTLYNASGTKLKSYSKTIDENNFRTKSKEYSFTVGKGKLLDYTLSPGTTYYYTFEVTIDGKKYTSSKFSFTTKTTNVDITQFTTRGTKNYLVYSNFDREAYSDYWKSRDTSVYTLSIKRQAINPADSNSDHYNTYLQIEGKTAGSSGKDLAINTMASSSQKHNNAVGDNHTYTLSFWAKSSVSGAKLYIRWGYSSSYVPVTLSTEWKYYTV